MLDDAHAGIEEVRDAFTIRLPFKSDLAQRIRKLLEGPLRAWMPGIWTGVVREDLAALLEVPYWIWRPLVPDVRELLADHAKDDQLKFVWGHLRDRLEFCRCIVGGEGIEITPDVPPVEAVRAFEEAKHRLFMSATLADDSALVRELGCAEDAAAAPVEPVSDAGVGERMVLVPTLIDKTLTREWLMTWCANMATKAKRAVVVLCPSKAMANEWAKHGAKAVAGEDVDQTVIGLRDGTIKMAAFANRYDGVDLPDDACRVLVIDGMPFGESMTTRHDATIPGRPSASQNRLVHRIEQGMGRAVRSHVDYAVVVLAGPDLASFMSRGEVLTLFNPATRAQLDLARRLADISLAETASGGPEVAFTNLALACIKRDQSWKDFYDAEVRQVAKGKRPINKELIKLAAMERTAAKLALHDPQGACDLICQNTRPPLVNDDRALGWYLQLAASYQFSANEAKALKLQAGAHAKNHRVFAPPRGTAVRPADPGRVEVPAAILRWYAGFENPNGAVAAVQALRARLSFGASYVTFERAVAELAEVVGAAGSQPESDFGEGPDDLWLWPDVSLVIECKNEEAGTTLPKKHSGQLHDSLKWFKDSYPTRTPTPVIVARASTGHEKAHFPHGTRVITPKKLEEFVDAVEKFVAALAKRPPAQWKPNEVAQLAAQTGVASENFVGKYTVALE
ncbi:helicase C-terminal domain-containing protein [Polyangium mundeleinium]|uniref:Helicase C-terminal domain-containing protein n=1 Tax=Polyangium mundeleinium TaxID=2995306 RepID=A0ABT5F8S8_9BACT|nr:helicase C-terminal domain-containing protein [Polyangium mundeleinium]MDC0750014.1 helicase C-terminal domain-containing protein [Polyangium mundeleinium]